MLRTDTTWKYPKPRTKSYEVADGDGMVEVNKIDVARCQLQTAICLFFDGGDVISIYSLAGNAWEILDKLCEKNDIISLREEAKSVAPNEDLKPLINNYRNFFKHADTDPYDEKKLSIEDVIGLLGAGVEDYFQLIEKAPIEIQVYQAWYIAAFLYEQLQDDKKGHIDDHYPLATLFPRIAEVPMTQKIQMGSGVLRESLCDKELLNNPKTEF